MLFWSRKPRIVSVGNLIFPLSCSSFYYGFILSEVYVWFHFKFAGEWNKKFLSLISRIKFAENDKSFLPLLETSDSSEKDDRNFPSSFSPHFGLLFLFASEIFLEPLHCYLHFNVFRKLFQLESTFISFLFILNDFSEKQPSLGNKFRLSNNTNV